MASETILNGRYRLIAQQGSGGMAVIYKAIDQMLGRQVAIKILRPSLTADPTFLARFRNEARSVANLQHPNIVTVYDVGQDGPTHYMVMEFVDGSDLKRVIKSEGALDILRAVRLGAQICAGIGFAHRSGLVHADVKPQNVLLTREDTVKVTDFGIAQALTAGQPGERQAVVWGSPHYFAPEQARGERPTPSSDVYSIGIVLFEMLTGRLPYSGQNQQELAMAHIRDPIPLVTSFNPSVPESLARIVYKTMSKEPDQRYRMAEQLKGILEGLLERGGAELLASVRAATPPGSTSPTIISGGKGGEASGERKTPPPSAPRPAAPSGGQPNIPLPPYSTHVSSGYQAGSAPRVESALPRGVEPLSGGADSMLPPTQRVDLAPHAPSSAPYPPPSPYGAAAHMPPQPLSGPPFSGNTSQLSASAGFPQPSQRLEQRNAPLLDSVTILLAIVAFMAVACLIPLYIAVFGARFGG